MMTSLLALKDSSPYPKEELSEKDYKIFDRQDAMGH